MEMLTSKNCQVGQQPTRSTGKGKRRIVCSSDTSGAVGIDGSDFRIKGLGLRSTNLFAGGISDWMDSKLLAIIHGKMIFGKGGQVGGGTKWLFWPCV